ncbi:BspA family leucine-rich repeat surface protein [Segatella copri]|uniref:BspA family leucine-rich repeat surface protein n=1 Tax=Segatella copri TaxID=165179 RepID=A0AA92WLV2_9BACT|nr:BspA family leucine-rich repeat surface protein [Segatella copri]RHL37404.1 BspA family leucine-rich repeat surface protein [Segatella copri]
MMKRFTNQSNGSQADRMNYGGAIIRRFALFPLMLLMLLLLPAGMVAQKAASSSKYIATYESSTQTLTFKEYAGETLPKNSAWVKDKQTVATINKNLGNGTIVHIVFDKSFSTYTPTSLYYFFANLIKLETITGLEYLNTEKVTDMSYMFDRCLSLTSLDVTHFNTANVTDMSSMFSNCSALTSLDVTHFNTANVTNMRKMFSICSALLSLDVTNFNTAKVTNMSYMFSSCVALTSLDVRNFNTANVTNMTRMFIGCSALLSLDVRNFNTANVTDMSYMFANCLALTSLYLTNFNTEKVTNMEKMFSSCKALTTIYASSKFVTTQVSNSSNMFYNCKKLKGEEVCTNDKATDKTYAKIEGGYFSGGIPRVKYADGTLTFFLTSKETLGENEYELNSGKNLPEWVKKHIFGITKVVFDTSFANARPTSCYMWFNLCGNLNQVEGIKNLNTKEVTDMADMFCKCRDLSSLDVSGFNTEKVTDMSEMFNECISLKLLDVAKFNTANVKSMSKMFYNCQNLASLNVTNFNTANVTNMQGMFYSCPALTTIYASDKFVTGQVTDGSNMFSNCINLKGFIDCKNNSDKTDHIFANYKTGYFTKLVGKNGDEKIGATGETLATDNLVLDDGKDFVAYEPFAAKAASYNRTMNAGTAWGTLCLPFGIAQSQETECKFYRLTGIDNDCITLESYEGAEIPAGTPVLFKMNENEPTLSISVQNVGIVTKPKAETNTEDVNLVGSFTKIGGKDNQGLADTDYIIGKDKFWRVSDLNDGKGVGIKPMRAYIHPATASQARAAMLSIGKGDGTTAIDNLNAISNDANAEYYDANGRRTNGLQKGLNIVKRGSKTYKIMVK